MLHHQEPRSTGCRISTSFPKSVEDDSELKDFDDIVIDDSKDKDDVASGDNAKNSVDDLNNAEKDDDTSVNTNSEA